MLAFDRVVAPGATPERHVLFLHGIFGRRSNWRSFAKRFVAERPSWAAVLADLRAHGDSQGAAPPHTVERAAADLDALALDAPVHAVVGHSFGGKVALQYLRRHPGNLDRVLIVDSNPGPRPTRRGSESTVAAVDTLARIGAAGSLATREEVVRAIEASGQDRATAQFLATNFDRTADGRYELAIDLDAIRALLDDYFALDLWDLVESPPGRAAIDLVAGGRSSVLDASDLDRVRRAAAVHPARVALHVVPDAGHWIHVDAPDALLTITLGALP